MSEAKTGIALFTKKREITIDIFQKSIEMRFNVT